MDKPLAGHPPSDGVGLALKIETQVAKYHGDRTPDDGEPDEVVTEPAIWVDAQTGDVITDPERIAQLEKGLSS
jgi:hypothetical protein